MPTQAAVAARVVPLRRPSPSFDVIVEENTVLGSVVDGRYRVTGLLAKGGTSRIFRAQHVGLRRVVALKVLGEPADPDDRVEARERFLREATACARLAHPNIVRVHDSGSAPGGLLYLAMDLIEGRSLHQVIKREGPLSPRRLTRVITQLCGALAHAHAHGLVHRDIKPANVMLEEAGTPSERVKLLDFGLVKDLVFDDRLTGDAGVVGSPSFMAPEQIRGEEADPRSDIYALGCVLFTCMTGHPPFRGSSPVGVLWSHLNEDAPRLPDSAPALLVYPDLAAVVGRCLRKNPSERYPDVAAFLEDFQRATDPLAIELPLVPAVQRRAGPARARVSLALFAGLMALAAAMGVAAGAIGVAALLLFTAGPVRTVPMKAAVGAAVTAPAAVEAVAPRANFATRVARMREEEARRAAAGMPVGGSVAGPYPAAPTTR